MENSEVIWCSSSYIRPENIDLESERKSIVAESIIETEYRIVSADDLGGVPLSGNEKVFAEQHLWSIQLNPSKNLKISDTQENITRRSYLGIIQENEDNTVFFNNWGKIGRIILFIYIVFLSMLHDITGIVIPNSVYKSELSGPELNIVSNTPSISYFYPYYWKYILEPSRYIISIIFYIIWGIELTPKKEFDKVDEDYRERLVKEEGITWMPRTLNIVHPINDFNNTKCGISIYSKPSENTIRKCKGIRTSTREHRIICNISKRDENNKRIRFVAIRPIGNVIAIGYANTVSILEYRPSILSNGNSGLNQLNSMNGGLRSFNENLSLNGKWNYIYSVDLFKLNSISWSNDGSSLYIGDGSSIREFYYIYLVTNDSKKLGYHLNSEKFINVGHVVARGPTIANDCVSIAVSGIFSLIGTIWEGGYFRIYDTFTWENIQICHKFGLRSKTFIPKVECVDNLFDKDSSSFIIADDQSIYETLLINQELTDIKKSKTVNISSISESQISNGIRLRELPIHTRNREKTIINFCTTFQRVAIIYKESNMVWLYCYLMSTKTPSKLMLIGVIQDFGIPLQLSMQTINESNHLVSGTLLSVKWQNSDRIHGDNTQVTQNIDSLQATIKTYPLFHYSQ